MTVSSTGTLKAVFASSFWKTTTPMKNPVGEHATVIYNGKLYRIGGQNASGNILKTVSFATINKDGTIGNWRSTTPLPEARHFPAGPHVVVYNNRIYVIGGNRPSPSKIETKTVWYAPINLNGTLGNWETGTSLPDTSQGHSTVVWNGRIYVMGGWTGGWLQDNVYYTEINPDGSIGSWVPTTPLPQPLRWGQAVVYHGIIYIMGGWNWGGTQKMFTMHPLMLAEV